MLSGSAISFKKDMEPQSTQRGDKILLCHINNINNFSVCSVVNF